MCIPGELTLKIYSVKRLGCRESGFRSVVRTDELV